MDVALPLVGEFQYRGATRLVEPGDAVLGDGHPTGDADLLLDLHLGRQTVTVPPESAVDALAAHRLVARHDVLDVARQQVAVVGEPVREGRAVVEDVLVAAF